MKKVFTFGNLSVNVILGHEGLYLIITVFKNIVNMCHTSQWIVVSDLTRIHNLSLKFTCQERFSWEVMNDTISVEQII
jgi:hypothetical protein